MAEHSSTLQTHPLQHGDLFRSPGCHFSYRVIGPCCRLFDREQLPWPCCRLQWRGKEPSWRRIGRRFVADMGTKRYPSYSVEILGQGGETTTIITLYAAKLSPAVRDWWHADKKGTALVAQPMVHVLDGDRSLPDRSLPDRSLPDLNPLDPVRSDASPIRL
jgi:hypothetical protein